MLAPIIIAIDGYSGCGKSSTSKAVARELGYKYIDSGAMYRAITLYFLNNRIAEDNPQEVEKALNQVEIDFVYHPETGKSHTYLNGEDVEQEIRKMQVTERVSEVSTLSSVRRKLVELQQQLSKNKGVVMDGRDIGTVVFPDAELKIFMQANLEIRAKRRQRELELAGHNLNLEEIIQNLAKRDKIDATRKDSPLRKADDAVLLDTSEMNFEEQVDKVVRLAKNKINGAGASGKQIL